MKTSKRPLPTAQDIAEFLRTREGKVGKREIARAFNIKGDDRIALKTLLKDMQGKGVIARKARNNLYQRGVLPETCQAEITGEDSDGYLIARPLNWNEDCPPPQIIMTEADKVTPTPQIGDILVVKTTQTGKRVYEGIALRRITSEAEKIVGIFITRGKGLSGQITSVDRRFKYSYHVDREDTLNAASGSIVVAKISGSFANRTAKVTKIIGTENDSNVASLIAIYQHSLPLYFPNEAIKQAEKSVMPPMTKREDLRNLPLVTIDGEDARDFDDAVYAEPDTAPNNKGGWHLIVAIADVAWFVRPETPLDISARERGNSVYFPDQAIHMLPDALSAGLSSLQPNQDRPCLVAHIWIDKEGRQKDKKFTRAMIRSTFRLNYHEVEDFITGASDKEFGSILKNLYEAFKLLNRQRTLRGALNLETDEKEIILDEKGNVTAIKQRERLLSHRLIEEFMIAANVAAAEVLEEKDMPVIYRVHEEPSPEKIAAFTDYLDALNLKNPIKEKPLPSDFNRILDEVRNTPNLFNVSEMILRTQSQACYSPENKGHFGLALKKYAHFTSPIRRYADLLVHRALITGLKLGEGGLDMTADTSKYFTDIAEHISFTERRADAAERDAEDRYTATFLHSREGEVFKGLITGVSSFGLFIRLNENGAEGLAPISTLPDEYYIYNAESFSLIGQNSGKAYRLGDEVDVILKEVTPITGSILLEVIGQRKKGLRPNFSAKRSFFYKKHGKYRHVRHH